MKHRPKPPPPPADDHSVFRVKHSSEIRPSMREFHWNILAIVTDTGGPHFFTLCPRKTYYELASKLIRSDIQEWIRRAGYRSDGSRHRFTWSDVEVLGVKLGGRLRLQIYDSGHGLHIYQLGTVKEMYVVAPRDIPQLVSHLARRL